MRWSAVLSFRKAPASLPRQMPVILKNAHEQLSTRMRRLLDFLCNSGKRLRLQIGNESGRYSSQQACWEDLNEVPERVIIDFPPFFPSTEHVRAVCLNLCIVSAVQGAVACRAENYQVFFYVIS